MNGSRRIFIDRLVIRWNDEYSYRTVRYGISGTVRYDTIRYDTIRYDIIRYCADSQDTVRSMMDR